MNNVPELVTCIIEAGLAAPTADNSQPWKFFWDGKRLKFTYDESRSGGLFFAESPAALLSMGAAVENMMVAASTLGADIEWTFESASVTGEGSYFSGLFHHTERAVNSEFRQNSLFKRHTNRWPYQKKPIPLTLLDDIAQMTEGNAKLKIYSQKSDITSLASLVKEASSMRFRIQSLHEALSESIKFSPQEVNEKVGLDVRTMPLPPGGRMLLKFISSWERMKLLNNVGLYRFFSVIESQAVKQSPAMIGVFSSGDKSDLIAAGQLMERVWCRLNEAGVAAHPYYVVTDQLNRITCGDLPKELVSTGASLQHAASEFFSDDCQNLQMLLRVGYPKRQPVYSMRVDVKDVLVCQ